MAFTESHWIEGNVNEHVWGDETDEGIFFLSLMWMQYLLNLDHFATKIQYSTIFLRIVYYPEISIAFLNYIYIILKTIHIRVTNEYLERWQGQESRTLNVIVA